MIKIQPQNAFRDPVFITPRKQGDGIRGNLAAGLVVSILLLGGFSAWATTAPLAGAVLAQGTVISSSSLKKVQHLTGGIVAEIRVKDATSLPQAICLSDWMRLSHALTCSSLLSNSMSLVSVRRGSGQNATVQR
jgi:hypothetical protein